MSRGEWAQNEVYYEILDSKLTLTYVLTVINNSRDRAIQIASSSASLSAVIQRTTVGLLWFVTGVNRASCCGRTPRVSVFVSATSRHAFATTTKPTVLEEIPIGRGGRIGLTEFTYVHPRTSVNPIDCPNLNLFESSARMSPSNLRVTRASDSRGGRSCGTLLPDRR